MYPSQEAVFERLFTRIAADGRGRELFGRESCSPLMERLAAACLGQALPEYYLEFPLGGKPWLDMLVLYSVEQLKKRASFSGPDPHGYRAIFKEACTWDVPKLCMGTELDFSRDAGEVPGFYISGAWDQDLVRRVYRALGEGEERVESTVAVLQRIPQDWRPYYIGAMPGRPGAPLRLGFTAPPECVARYAGSQAALRADLEGCGFTALSSEMLELLAQTAELGLGYDVQFDVLADGSLGPVLGVSLFAMSETNALTRESFATGTAARLMGMLEQRGLADERWRRVPECLFVDRMYYGEDQQLKTLGLICRANFAKVKWTEGRPGTAKFYLAAKGFDVDAESLAAAGVALSAPSRHPERSER